MEKPVNPQFIRGEGYETEPEISIGDKLTYVCRLEKGRPYHIYLVGEWVNFLDPQTDYDIKTYAPDEAWTSHTESTGLPEQVANRGGGHRYFVPDVTDDYRFEIKNDPRDSNASEGAVFMIIEHVDINVRYRRYLKGRDAYDKPVLYTSWAYEFNTSAQLIRVFVEVPGSLDMFEVRLYPMANPEKGIGYEVDGVPVPFGNLLHGDLFEDKTTGIVYGGFNTTIEGYRDSRLMASCEYNDEDMEVIYELPKAANQTSTDNETSKILYALVLIAEYGEGEVEFYVQTDFSPPNITLVEPPEVGAWSVLAQVISDDIHYAPSQSDLLELLVTPLGPLDRIVDVLWMITTPPYQYVTIGMAGAVVALAVFKGGGRLASLFKTTSTTKTSKRKSKGRNDKRGQRYRRNKR